MTQLEVDELIKRVEDYTNLEFIGSPMDDLLKFTSESDGGWFEGDDFEEITNFIDILEQSNPDIGVEAEIEILNNNTFLYLSIKRT